MSTYKLISVQGQAPCWYRVAKKGDWAECLIASDASASSYIRKFLSDPHTEAALKKGDIHAELRHPVNIIPAKTKAVLKFIDKGDVLFNRSGGWMTPINDMKIVETRECDSFPPVTQPVSDSQRAKIIKWYLGRHYYVNFWPLPMTTSKDKFDTLEEAMAEALKVVPKERISVEESHTNMREGD